MPDPSLTPFFTPRGVVIVGASRDPTKLGYALARNILASGYSGAVHYVNPKGDTLFGQPIYHSIAEVPDPVDLAILLTPAPSVADMLRECGERRIPAAVVSSGGFRETGSEGAALEAGVLKVAHQYGMRIIGPNCVGIIDTHLPINGTFLPPPPPPVGEIAFISHSGAICSAINDWLRGQGMGLSMLISLGNQADVNETDVMGPVAADKHTSVLCFYMEGVSNGRRFVSEARQVVPRKPVIALKVGRYESGRRAAASHTGALAGSETAFAAAFRRAGVIRANTTEEMFQWARALAWCPLPKGRRVAIVTNAGGPGVTAADALESNGLLLASFSAETHTALASLLPAAASLHNPVDMLASASPEHYAGSLSLALADPGVDSVMIILPASPIYSTGAIAKATIPLIQTSEKPVVVALMGDRLIQEAVEHYRAAHVAEYRFPEWAASALAVLCQRAESLPGLAEEPEPVSGIDLAGAAALLKGGPAGEFLPSLVVTGLLEAYGIPALTLKLAQTADEAVALAERAGYPVVLKVASPDIPHKSDIGGVLLNLVNALDVQTGFHTVIEQAQTARPEAHIQGVHVQRMVPAGQEVIIGVVQDRQFGPMLMFGSGGVEVEGLKDVAFALAPLTRREAEGMLAETWAGRKLKGFRSLAPADRTAVLETLFRLGQLAADFPQIAEIEINPLRVLAPGQGAIAIDARARLAGQA